MKSFVAAVSACVALGLGGCGLGFCYEEPLVGRFAVVACDIRAQMAVCTREKPGGSVGGEPGPRSGTRCGAYSTSEPSRPTRHPWAELMRRVFEIDVLVCPHCEGERKLIAFLTDETVVRKILDHLGIDSEPPILARARALEGSAFAW